MDVWLLTCWQCAEIYALYTKLGILQGEIQRDGCNSDDIKWWGCSLYTHVSEATKDDFDQRTSLSNFKIKLEVTDANDNPFHVTIKRWCFQEVTE